MALTGLSPSHFIKKNSGSIPIKNLRSALALFLICLFKVILGQTSYGFPFQNKSAKTQAHVLSQGQITRLSRSGRETWSLSAGVSSGTNETEWTAN